MLLNEDGNRMLIEMRESQELCCIDLSSDFDFCWDVSFVRYQDEDHVWEKVPWSEPDLNMAIEAAYKLWKGEIEGIKWRKTLGEPEILNPQLLQNREEILSE